MKRNEEKKKRRAQLKGTDVFGKKDYSLNIELKNLQLTKSLLPVAQHHQCLPMPSNN